jgi:Zn-dependent protease with chaperone function
MTAIPVSANFRKKAYYSIASIVFFGVVYLALLALSFGIFAGLVFLVVLIISVGFSFPLWIIGFGLIVAGVFIIIFMIKFMFAKSSTRSPGFMELDITTEPRLHLLVRELVTEIGTQFPKKIFLSHEVNASVFYDSSFWSMFIPVRKNLHIGLGLVNTTSISELKGILAHEFGHFSQKSMKLGSFVYNLNRIIYNMLYENKSYDRALDKWSRNNKYYTAIMWLAKSYISLVQFILKEVYKIVNLNYMALSREMEFHADAIAVRTVGSQPMISSLLRTDLSTLSLQTVLDHYEGNISNAVLTDNIFSKHYFTLGLIASANNIDISNNLPEVTEMYVERFQSSKLVITDQWSSHPSNKERISQFRKACIPLIAADFSLANSLFTNIEATQQKLTAFLFSKVKYTGSTLFEDDKTFENTLKQRFSENNFPNVFKGYYDRHPIDVFDIDEIYKSSEEDGNTTGLFADEIIELVDATNAMRNDSASLKSIRANHRLKTFDYDGKKYKIKDALTLSAEIDAKILKLEGELKNNDLAIFRYFAKKAADKNEYPKLKKLYHNYFRLVEAHTPKYQLYADMVNDFAFAYETLKFESILAKMDIFLDTEKVFMETISALLSDELYMVAISPELAQRITNYTTSKPTYFRDKRYNSEAIRMKNELLLEYATILNRSHFIHKKNLLDFQAGLFEG